MSESAPAVEANDVHVQRGGTAILRGINCRLERGRCAAMLGPNGCGKTTFARALTGHMFPTAGTLHVLGHALGHTDIRALRKQIGVVNPTVDAAGTHMPGAVVDAELTATQAVVTGFFASVGLYETPTNAQLERSRHVLQQLGLAHRAKHRFRLLSTGEQRRALIARALVHWPSLLILDEPTAGLDLPGREQVLATIEQILAEPDPPAVLMITHHVEELSPRTDHVLLMREGQILQSGPPKRIITPETLSELFGCQVDVRRSHGRYWLEVLPEAWLDLLPDRSSTTEPPS